MSTRREFFSMTAGSLAAATGITGLDTNSAKEIYADEGKPLVVIELNEMGCQNPESFAKTDSYLKEKFPDLRFLVVPHDTRMWVIPANGQVYHREKVGNYEIEIVAKDEETLRDRLSKGILCE